MTDTHATEHDTTLDSSDIGRITHPDSESGSERPSWLPVDLAPYIAGTARRDEPTMGIARTDGLRLLYPGKEHTVIGETESGKTMFALACAAAELNAYDIPTPKPPEGLSESNDDWEVKPARMEEFPDGSVWEVGPIVRWKHQPSANRHVLYFHFEESDPTPTVHRLHDMGVRWIDIRENFHFVALDVPLTPDRYTELEHDVAERMKSTRNNPFIPPVLVVIDGMNEAMALHGWDIRDESGVAAFRRTLIKPFKKIGAATLICDHVVKDREKRGRTPLGSIHKLNGLDGAGLLLENVDPMGQGKRGASKLYVTKDRPGALRKHGSVDNSLPGKTYMGMFIVDSVPADEFSPQSYIDVSIVPPSPQETSVGTVDKHQEKDDNVFAVAKACMESNNGIPVNTRDIRAIAKMRHEDVSDSLTRLAEADRLTRTGSGRAVLWGLP